VGGDAGGDAGDTWDVMLEGRLEEGKDDGRDGKVHGDSDGIVSSWSNRQRARRRRPETAYRVGGREMEVVVTFF
jgi:hypothetical protein